MGIDGCHVRDAGGVPQSAQACSRSFATALGELDIWAKSMIGIEVEVVAMGGHPKMKSEKRKAVTRLQEGTWSFAWT